MLVSLDTPRIAPEPHLETEAGIRLRGADISDFKSDFIATSVLAKHFKGLVGRTLVRPTRCYKMLYLMPIVFVKKEKKAKEKLFICAVGQLKNPLDPQEKTERERSRCLIRTFLTLRHFLHIWRALQED
jgi:hypothetical protein